MQKTRVLGGDASGDESQTVEVSSDYCAVEHVLNAMKESDQKFKALGEANKKRKEKEIRLQNALPIKF